MTKKLLLTSRSIKHKKRIHFVRAVLWQHRLSFPKLGARRASIVGETFHVDLCGKMSTPSIGDGNYFMLLKDDFCRYCYIYFLKNKTDVLDNLMKFYAEVEADGHKIKRPQIWWRLGILQQICKTFSAEQGDQARDFDSKSAWAKWFYRKTKQDNHRECKGNVAWKATIFIFVGRSNLHRQCI